MTSVEGPHMPDVCHATAQEEEDMNELISDAYDCWIHKPRR